MKRRQLVLKLAALAVVLGVGYATVHPRLAQSQVVGPLLQAGSYVSFPGGLTVEFGGPTATVAGGGTIVITYPKACNTAVLDAHAQSASPTSSQTWLSGVGAASMTINNGGTASTTYYWQTWCV